MIRLPSSTYWATFPISDATGAAIDADSTPTATARRNGTTDGTFTLTVLNLSTGLYRVTGTVPSGYTAGDSVQIEVAATIDGIAAKAVIDSFVIDTARASEVYSRIGAPAGASIAADIATRSSHSAADVWSVGTRSLTTFGTLVSDIWSNATRTLSAFAFTVDTNANATETAIKAKTDNLPAQPASAGDITALGTTIGEPLQADDYTAPPTASEVATAVWANGTRTLSSFGTLVADVATAVWGAATRTLSAFGFTVSTSANATETAIKAKTDLLTFTGTDVHALADVAISSDTIDDIAEATDALLTTSHGAGTWGSTAAGTGARTVTITVTDGADPIEGARVRLTKGIESYVDTTDADGEAQLFVDDGTWTRTVTATGYSSSSASLPVDGNETASVTLTQLVYAGASEPDLCRVHFDLFQLGAEDVSGQKVIFAIQGTAGQTTTIGNEIVPSGTEYEAESDDDGVGYMDLPYSSLITNGEIYVTSSAARLKNKLITVPDAASALLVDLI